MLRRLVCPIVLFLATDAIAGPADLELGEQQLALQPRRDLMDESDQQPYARVAAFAQLTGGGTDKGDLGMGVATAVSGLGCDVVSGTVQGRLRPFAEHPIVGDGQWGVCLSRLLVTTVFEGHHELGVAPALDARHSLWRRRYDASYEKLTVGLGEIPSGRKDEDRHSVLLMAIGHGVTTQTDTTEQRRMAELDVDVAIYRYRHVVADEDFTLDVASLTADAMKASVDDKGAVTTSFAPVRARIETPAWFAEGSAAWGMSGGVLRAHGETQVNGQTTSSWTETIDATGLPEMTKLVGTLGGGIRGRWGTASVRAARSLFPTFEGNLAFEDRVSGAVTYRLGHRHETTLSLSPFVAATTTWARDGMTSRDRSVGASLHLGRDLNQMLRLDAIGEAGLSPYTRLDGAPEPTSTLGGQVVLALSAHVAQ